MNKKLLFGFGFFASVLTSSFNSSAQYCIPSYDADCGAGDNIEDFTLYGSGINHLGSACSPSGYGDFTADPTLLGNLQSTVTYNFQVTHNYNYDENVNIYIDLDNDQAFDEVTELLFSSPIGTDNSPFTNGSITIPSIAPVNGLRMRVMVAYGTTPTSCGYSYYGETHDYTVNILPPPTCSSPSNNAITAVGAYTADIEWDAIGNGIGYNIEWGTPGFTPGTGAEDGSFNTTLTSYQISGLTPATDYQYYVQTDCDVVDGLSYWAGPFSFTTNCVPIASLPWNEDFEGMTSTGEDLFPNCWVKEGDQAGTDDYTHWFTYNNADALSGDNYMYFAYGGEEYVFTPEFELTAGVTYQFAFNWAGDTYDGWDGEVVVSQSQSSMDAVSIGGQFVSIGDETSIDYKKETYCFTPDTDGTYSFGFHISESYYNYYLNIDDVSLKVAQPTVGTDSTLSVCEQSGVVNLDDLGQITDFDGQWTFPTNPSAISNGNELNIDVIPNTTVSATYVTQECLASDVVVTFTVVPAVTAGDDGTLTACRNQMVDLLGGLQGSIDLGGQWYNSSDVAIPGSYINTGNLPGQFIYTYIVGNGGICDDDTSTVILNINSCDFLGIDELEGSELTVYPNPSAGIFAVTGDFGNGFVSYQVISLNGETIANHSNFIAENNEILVDLSGMVPGMYLLKISVNEKDQVFRIVKQ